MKKMSGGSHGRYFRFDVFFCFSLKIDERSLNDVCAGGEYILLGLLIIQSVSVWLRVNRNFA